jgi:hypothetical protein
MTDRKDQKQTGASETDPVIDEHLVLEMFDLQDEMNQVIEKFYKESGLPFAAISQGVLGVAASALITASGGGDDPEAYKAAGERLQEFGAELKLAAAPAAGKA